MVQQTSDVGIREATLTALKGVIKHAGGSVSIASRTRVYTLLKDLIHNDDDQIRSSAASIFGIISQVRVILPRKHFFSFISRFCVLHLACF